MREDNERGRPHLHIVGIQLFVEWAGTVYAAQVQKLMGWGLVRVHVRVSMKDIPIFLADTVARLLPIRHDGKLEWAVDVLIVIAKARPLAIGQQPF